jgi:hypothetical protein
MISHLNFQNVKRNKEECIQLMESVQQIVHAIIHLVIKSETVGSLPPARLFHVGKFTECVHLEDVIIAEKVSAGLCTKYTRMLKPNNLETRSSTSSARVK